MASSDPWPYIHTERRSLVTDLEKLAPEQWDKPSLCPEWSVRDVVAHLTAGAKITPGSFFPGLISAGFKFEKLQTKGVDAELGSSPADTLARFANVLTATTKPPGPVDTPLGEIVVHSEDIRRPLGIAHDYDPEALVRLADFYRKSNLIIGGKRRASGVAFRATDASWSAGGGPEVTGPMLSIVLAITGRTAALDDLDGPGVETLRLRA